MSPYSPTLRSWRTTLPVVALCALAAPLATASAASATPHEALFTTWARNVPIRLNIDAPNVCGGRPSASASPTVVGHAQSGHELLVHCLRPGQPVGGDRYWASVVDHTNNSLGWIPAAYLRPLNTPTSALSLCPG